MNEIISDKNNQKVTVSHYSDLTSWCNASGWEFKSRQIEAGKLEAKFSSCMGKYTQLHKTQLNKRVHQQGIGANALIHFAIPFNKGRLVWHRDNITAESLLNFSGPQGVDAVSDSCFSAFIISTDKIRLQQLAHVLGINIDLDTFLTGNAANTVCCDKVPQLRACMQRFHTAMQISPRLQNSISVEEEIDGNLPTQLLYALADPIESNNKVAAAVRGNVIERALEYINQHAREAITVRELCESSAVTWRTLERAFRNHFQITPKAYLKSVRLNGVRDELLQIHGNEGILDVAYRWGFWHSGQFASDYRKHFGELPTATLMK